MILHDCHMHSSFSSDSKTPPEDQIKQAISLGMKGICFTDHIDYEFPNIERSGLDFLFDVDEYFKELEELRYRYRNEINIGIGVELGLRDEEDCSKSVNESCRNLVESYPFDFVIGSTHCLEYTDPYYEDPYWTDKSVKEGISTYFQAVLYNASHYDSYDSLGHLDYAVRFVPKERNWDIKDYDPREYFDIIDRILENLIEREKALEVNTAGIKYGLGFAHPKTEILKRYRQLGGELITIGSDGHKTEHICYAFDESEEMIKSLGFKYYAVYRGRKAEMIKL